MASIPANPDRDDDLRIRDYIEQQKAALAERDAALVAVEEAKKALEEIVHECVNFENSSRKSLEVILGITHRALSLDRVRDYAGGQPFRILYSIRRPSTGDKP